MTKDAPIYVAGHTGLVGSALLTGMDCTARIPLREGIEETYRWYCLTAAPVARGDAGGIPA